MQTVIDDTWQLGVLDECDLVDMCWLVTSHEEVFVQIGQIWHQFFTDELCIYVGIVVLQQYDVVVGRAVGCDRIRLGKLIVDADVCCACAISFAWAGWRSCALDGSSTD